MKNTALVIVDMQEFFLKNFIPASRNILVANQEKIIDLCVKNSAPTFLIEYKAGGVLRGKTIGKLSDKVKRILKETIIKESNSAFTGTDLDKMLQDLNVRKIILMGINANGCVQDTTIGALHRGYSVITSEGVIASSSRGDMSLSKRNKDWFARNTKFFSDFPQLLDYLAK